MFTIYNNGIVDYKSSTENLYNVKNINETTKFTFDPKEDSVKDFQNKQDQNGEKKKQEQFLSSYKKISQINQGNQFFFVRDIMSQDLLYIDNSHTIKEAYELLKDKKTAQIPVTTIDKKIVGLIDAKFILSLLMQNLDEPNLLLNRRLKDISFPEIITTNPDSELKDVIKIMFDFEIGTMAVVNEEGLLKGIISKSYIFKAMSCIPQLEIWS
ncbi:CBS domain-containing protein [Aliarcobacter faecis]|uniref:CBS domain-containing protein n=1 Tax=Aliarcobacter faecis TaxID=1564138 RepID=UPI00047BD595|nr:CBS domain-containing protein [Aliarcobacter faecis]QKF73759.1 CBS domain-containing protein [Aliarcobacter faecis]